MYPAAVAWASEKQRLRFGCVARPAVADATVRTVAYCRGTPMLGWIFASYLRARSAEYFTFE